MVLWVDKYRPTTLPTLELHADVTNRLQQMISSGDFPHILMWGPSGAGKKTRVNAMLKALYGPAAGKVKVTQKQFKVKVGHACIPAGCIGSVEQPANSCRIALITRLIDQDH